MNCLIGIFYWKSFLHSQVTDCATRGERERGCDGRRHGEVWERYREEQEVKKEEKEN